MWSWLKAAGPDANLQLEIGEAVPFDDDRLWLLHNAKRKTDNAEVSVFTFDSKGSPDGLPVAKNALKRFKTLRHPSLLKYLDSYEGEKSVTIVTEQVVPLTVHLQRCDQEVEENKVTRQQLQLETKWGVYQALMALQFLHSDCKLAHNAVSMGTIFVDRAGQWKIGGLGYVGSGEANATALLAAMPMEISRYLAPEIKSSGLSSSSLLGAADMFGLGAVLYQCYGWEGRVLDMAAGELSSCSSKIPKALRRDYCAMVSLNPRDRPTPGAVLERGRKRGGFFDDPFVDTCLSLELFQLKDADQQSDFLKQLPTLIQSLPPRFQQYKVLPAIINAVMYSGASAASTLTLVLEIGKLLTPDEYESQVVTCVVKLFGANDRATRMSLLQHLELFADHLRDSVVNDTIFPQVAQGFTDTLGPLRLASVKACLLLVPKLTERTINNVLLRHFARLQVDPEPGIRANTAICLGKMATYFSEATRKKVLVVAFSRALRDPFVHSRTAALLALAATQEYYEAETVARNIIPLLSVAAIDPEEAVRSQAFKTLSVFIQRLQALAAAMPATAIPSSTNQPPSNLPAAPEQRGSQTGHDTTWAGWALASAVGTLTKAVSTGTKDTRSETERDDLASVNNPTVQDSKPANGLQAEVNYSATSPAPTNEIDGNQWSNEMENEADGWDQDWEPIETFEPPKARVEYRSPRQPLEMHTSPAMIGSSLTQGRPPGNTLPGVHSTLPQPRATLPAVPLAPTDEADWGGEWEEATPKAPPRQTATQRQEERKALKAKRAAELEKKRQSHGTAGKLGAVRKT